MGSMDYQKVYLEGGLIKMKEKSGKVIDPI
jgi:hypothetical protein